jgi:hypothetical protein
METGEIVFRGIPGTSDDRSAQFSFRCFPPGFIPDDWAMQIASHLSRGAISGKIGEDEWRVEKQKTRHP